MASYIKRKIGLNNELESFALQNYMQLSQTDEFLELTPDVLCYLIANDEIVVPSERDIFFSCLKWIEHDRVNREQFISQLLKHVRWHLLPTAFITEYIMPEYKDLVIEAMQRHLETELTSERSPSRTKLKIDCEGTKIGLTSQVDDFILQNYMEISKTEEFLDISPELLCKIIANDEIVVPSEKDIFFSCLKWIQHDRVNREKFIQPILTLIRLHNLPASILIEHVKPLCNMAKCKDLFIEAMQGHMVSQLTTGKNQRRQISAENLLVVGKWTHDMNVIIIQSYCPTRDKWTEWNVKLPKRRISVAAVMNDTLYFTVGVSRAWLSRFGSINLKSLTATTLKSFETPREEMSIAVFDGCIYIVGGLYLERVTNRVEKWNPHTGTWSYVAAMTVHRFGAGVAVLNKLLYAVGGSNGYVLATVECYDPRANKWSERASMSEARMCAGVTAGRGYLYAMGGWVGRPPYASSVERYDPAADKWTLICSLSLERKLISCAFLGNRLFAVGGYATDNKWQSKVEEYDFENDKWITKNSLIECDNPQLFSTPHMIPPITECGK